MGQYSRLNNFILWCKGWYVSVNESEDVFNLALKALKLDGYEFATTNDINGIALRYIDDLIEDKVITSNMSYLRQSVWNSEIERYMNLFNMNYQQALLFTIKQFFAFEITNNEIVLTPPTYSRKLYKLGFVAPKHFGNSYKMANYKTLCHFNNKKCTNSRIYNKY